ncbi:hypothetical protein D3C71_24170 [compost metagenome]
MQLPHEFDFLGDVAAEHQAQPAGGFANGQLHVAVGRYRQNCGTRGGEKLLNLGASGLIGEAVAQVPTYQTRQGARCQCRITGLRANVAGRVHD